MIRIVHYLNQFYGRLGGEAAAWTAIGCALVMPAAITSAASIVQPLSDRMTVSVILRTSFFKFSIFSCPLCVSLGNFRD